MSAGLGCRVQKSLFKRGINPQSVRNNNRF
uniref:Uncharacterized protein n=1 Tax=Siphoviridae sp. ctFSL3 TaxID=2825404 RepID=A0A8S5PEC7_9CAUD|nr:MAG TPA: hypothetical protein [Siphoviridae sp. ctFSL3]